MEAKHGADLDVEIDVLVRLKLPAGRAGHRRFDEAASVKDVTAQRRAQDSIGPTFGSQRGLVAVGKDKDRKARRDDLAGGIKLDGALHRGARRLDRQLLEP